MASAKPQRQRVRSLSIYEGAIKRLGRFRVAHPVQDPAAYQKVGFDGTPNDGDTILPAVHGNVTEFNANGKQVVRRDLPKVPESFMSHRTWNDWHGNQHSGIQLRTMQVYQRDLILPPSEYITAANAGQERMLCSRVMSLEVDGEEAIVHVLNMFLELFGGLEIVSETLDRDAGTKVHRLNWRILPPGPYPFERAREALQDFMGNLPEPTRPVVEGRIQHITRFKPDFMAVGLGGFRDYVVLGFTDLDIFILESPALGNATYVFNRDWASLSTKTKAEILAGSLHEARIVHNYGWHRAVRELLDRQRRAQA